MSIENPTHNLQGKQKATLSDEVTQYTQSNIEKSNKTRQINDVLQVLDVSNNRTL